MVALKVAQCAKFEIFVQKLIAFQAFFHINIFVIFITKIYHKVSWLFKSLLQAQLEKMHQQAGLICLFKKALQKVDA